MQIYWMPLCLKSLDGMTATKIGLLSALIYFVAMVGMGVFARLSDSSGKHAHYLAASMLVSCLGFCGLAVSLKLFPHEAVVVCCFCVVAFGLWGVMGPFWALAPLQFSRAEAPIGIPLVNSMGVAGSFAGPLVVAALVGNTNSFVIAFAVSAGLSAASALAAVALMCMPSSFQRIPDSV
jgi:ACS family tartrate transporter-like MFS transporter